jgi:adenine/guanine phosphoribosyltransferase-like PRPP-binding protein
MIYGTVSEKGDAHGNLDDLEAAVRKTTKYLREHSEKFDFIAVRGMSGVLVGAPVALRLRKPLVVVRKKGEHQHAYGSLVNAAHASGRYVFLDDFISGGGTRDAVKHALAKCTYAGSYLYHDNQYGPAQGGWVTAPAEAVAA